MLARQLQPWLTRREAEHPFSPHTGEPAPTRLRAAPHSITSSPLFSLHPLFSHHQDAVCFSFSPCFLLADSLLTSCKLKAG